MALAPAANGVVHAITTDGNTVYVAGSFTTFGGTTGFKYIARYSAVTGAVDTSWKPQLPNYGGPIASLQLSPDKQSIFIGWNAGSQGQNHLQKWSTSTALQENFMTVSWYGGALGDGVLGMHLDGNNLYICGNWKVYTPYGGSVTATSCQGVLKIDITGNSGTGSVVGTFAPTGISNVQSMAADSDFLYLGGTFTTVNGVTSKNIVKLNKSNGQIASDWTTGANQHFAAGTVRGLLIGSDNNVYAAGVGLSSYRGTSLTAPIAKISKSGVLQAFTNPFSSTASFESLIEVDGQLYLTRRPVSGAGAGIVKGTDGLNSFIQDAAFTATISNVNTNNKVKCNYNGLNLLVAINADSGAYNGSGSAYHYAISKSSGAVAHLQSDTTGPTVSLASASVSSGGTTNSEAAFTATFNETVTGFVAGDISVTNGSVSGFSGSGTSYSFTVIPSAGGAVSVSVASGVCQDSFGNNNQASSAYSFTYDTTAPTVTLASSTVSSGGMTATSPVSMTATFSESVTGFTVGDVTVSGGTAGSFSGSGTSYSFAVTPSGDGVVSVSISSGVCQDAAGNQNTASSAYSFTFDSTAPTVTLSATNASTGLAVASGSVIAQVALTIAASFSEAVTGVAQGDFVVSGGTISNFSVGSGGGTFTLTPTGSGTMTVKMASASMQDTAGNQNSESNTLSFSVQGEVMTLPSPSVAKKAVMQITLSKSAVAGKTSFAQNTWRRILAVYKATGKPNVVMSFKPSQATPSSRFRANINTGASYQLDRMIVVNTSGKSDVVLRAALSNAEQYDIQVT